jgi:hypothetical protein
MPRAGVHTRRDLPIVARELRGLGLRFEDETVEDEMLQRHRAIDRNQEEEDMPLHFMRGPEEEGAGEAVAKALGHIKRRTLLAAPLLRRCMDRPGDEPSFAAALLPITDACHAVRDSYSRGHATRSPGPGGDFVAEIRSWEVEKTAIRGFGTGHALRRDIRFEWPLSRRAPEVPASDAAVEALLGLIAGAAGDKENGAQRVVRRWDSFVAGFFLPPGAGPPDKEEEGEGQGNGKGK